MAKKNKDNQAQTSAEAATATLEPEFNLEQWRQVKSGLHLIPLELVRESEDNARQLFDQDKLRELAESIASRGGVNSEPALVKPIPPELEQADGACFELLSGARRFRALQLNGAKFIKAIIETPADKTDELVTAFISNLHRQDLNPIEKMRGMLRIMDEKRLHTVEALAKALGLSAHVRSLGDLLHLQNLCDEASEALIDNRITLSHAVLIAREDKEDQPAILKACFRVEQIDNGGGMEPVEVLISEKKLRDYIKENYRTQAPQADMFQSEEQQDQARCSELEEKADQILERDGETGGAGDGETVEADAGTRGRGDAGNEPDEADISDDDLTPEQARDVKPQAAGEYEKEERARIEMLDAICARVRFPYPIAIYKLLAVQMASVVPQAKLSLVAQALKWPVAMGEYKHKLTQLNQNDIESMQFAAKAVVAMALADELNPNVEPDKIAALTHILNIEADADVVAKGPGARCAKEKPAKKSRPAKQSKKPETVNLAKAIAKNKAAVAKKKVTQKKRKK
ncbi:MAG TPA: ParB/RepB/Spo0J family partition protein [Planctomycetota bacterium]|nr:ParB/RepB/Spo0J family partition protein [Planctomycetota bacterium]